MRAVDVSCEVISGLLFRWQGGALPEADRDAYEQHLLFCPPCMAQNDKAHVALSALGAVPAARPDEALRRRLAGIVNPGPER
ncbi:zf-HC2 domain-containing protein [Actinomadura chokoriensis]|uniref:Zf-HC2 domain-containing protein n=1 Tax=Actinomadura chokoriensis TaxID=454156 RepID=A0ABV4R1K6_9ACTN